MNGKLLLSVWFASLFAVQISWAQLTITSSGQIGIGITSPASDTKLHMQHTGAGLRAGYFEGGALGLHAKATVSGSGNRIALTGQASGGSGTNYGVYGSGSGGATNYAGYFLGNVTVTGTFSNPSDDNLKENIDSLSAVLPALNRLRPIRFHFRKDADYQDLNLPPARQYGFSAQELESVFPELVRTESHLSPGVLERNREASPLVYKSVNYLGLIPLLVEAIKEQQAMITELQDEVNRLKQESGCAMKMTAYRKWIAQVAVLISVCSPAVAADKHTVHSDTLHHPGGHATIPSHKQAYTLHSGVYDGRIDTNREPTSVFRGVVEVPNAPWLKLYFDACELGGRSYLKITSREDGAY